MSLRATNQKHEALKDEMAEALKVICAKHPEIRNIEIIAVLGRVAGYCVAMCFPDERDLARQTAIMNLDAAVRDVAQDGPSTGGRA
jgi:hypothetical protein